MVHTVDGRNPANHLSLVVYPIIYDGFFFTSQVVGRISSINKRTEKHVFDAFWPCSQRFFGHASGV